MPHHRARGILARSTIAVVLLSAACSNGADNDTDDDGATTTSSTGAATETSSTASSSTEPADTTTTGATDDTSTTSTPSTTSTGVSSESRGILDETLTTDDGTAGGYRLVLRNGDLCFEAGLDNPDPAIDATFGTGIDDCFEGLAETDGPLSASIGSLDGEQRFGYAWGRASAGVTRLVMRFADGDEIELELVAVDETQVFATVVDTQGRGEAETLDALDAGGETVASLPIRAFLRSGPTYPSVAPTTAPPPTYPSTGGAGGPTGSVDG